MTDALRTQAGDFARELHTTLSQVLASQVPEFVVETPSVRSGNQTKILIRPAAESPIPLQINGTEALALVCEYTCVWDNRGTYLKVTSSKLHVTTVDGGAPLFRYEFTEHPGDENPVAHLHVHAHRDELLYALLRGGGRRARKRLQAAHGQTSQSPPRLASIHFPLGGARMRPCLEDVLEMLWHELDVGVRPQAATVLAEGRARWRRRQIAAAVRDAPSEAARVLREMGYAIEAPATGERPERTERLARY